MTQDRARPTATTLAAAARAPRQRTCFVVTGFSNKTDHATGRVLNLDQTYEQLIRPACDRAGVNCFRAIDANLTGSIDSLMYRWIFEADLVIADLSTLNANVFYELGVRHAQRPCTTIIMAESVLMQKVPFDLSSFVVHQYVHGGEAIDAAEQTRFVAHLAGVIEKIVAAERRRARRPGAGIACDSPIYTFLNGMTPPTYQGVLALEPPAYVPVAERATKPALEGGSLASVIDAAEAAKKRKDYPEAMRLFGQAVARQTQGTPPRKPDVFLAQRLALVTYKDGERRGADGRIDPAAAMAALHAAESILAEHCAPKISNDPETLALSGAINKRRFEVTGDLAYLERAIGFYERGFHVKQDYYNGINVAYMHTQRANLLDDRFDAIVSYGHANMIRRKVVEICTALIDDEAVFAARGDKEWVYMSLAEAYQGLGLTADEARLAHRIEVEASDFGKDTYHAQKAKLRDAMATFDQRVRPGEINATHIGASVGRAPADGAARAPVASPLTTTQQYQAAATDARRPITIDADIVPGRVIRSVEIHCKIDYL